MGKIIAPHSTNRRTDAIDFLGMRPKINHVK